MTAASLQGDVLDRLRTRLLTFQPLHGQGDPLSTQLDCALAVDGSGIWNGGLYVDQAPDNAAYPYAVMRFASQREGAYGGDRLAGELEIQVYGRPRAMLASVKGIADTMQQALQRWSDTSGQALILSHEDRRETLPMYGSPADREVCAERLVFDIVAWPRYLSLSTES